MSQSQPSDGESPNQDETDSTQTPVDPAETKGPEKQELADEEAEKVLNTLGHFENRIAESTRETYKKGWRDFKRFCREHDHRPLPASEVTVVLYINERFGKHSPNTIQLRLSAIRHYHEEAGEEDPTQSRAVRGVMKGVKRESEHQVDEAYPLLTRHIKKMVDGLREMRPEKTKARTNRQKGNRLRSLRDEAVLLVGYAGALRRSEIAAMEEEHLIDRETGYALLIPESKTDQEGDGQYVGITRTESEYCPCEALDRWLEAAGITSGGLFRGVHWKGAVMDDCITPRTVNNIIEDAAEGASLRVSPSGHSLRAGHITQATINGVPDGVIRAQSRHEDPSTFYGYQRVHKALDNSSSQHLDL